MTDEMLRKANLELGLVPLSDPSNIQRLYNRETELYRQSLVEKPSGSLQQHRPLTIFYNGNICVADVTEAQASSILALASRQTGEKNIMSTPSGSSEEASPSMLSPATSIVGLSMKRSLERFLQKRKNRILATNPCPIYGFLS